MIQIISSNKNDVYDWLTDVIFNHEQRNFKIEKLILIASCTKKEDDEILDIDTINYFNCSNKELLDASTMIYKEILKEEILQELGIEELSDDDFEEE